MKTVFPEHVRKMLEQIPPERRAFLVKKLEMNMRAKSRAVSSAAVAAAAAAEENRPTTGAPQSLAVGTEVIGSKPWTMPACPVPSETHDGGSQADDGPLFRPGSACPYLFACASCLAKLDITRGPRVFAPVTFSLAPSAAPKPAKPTAAKPAAKKPSAAKPTKDTKPAKAEIRRPLALQPAHERASREPGLRKREETVKMGAKVATKSHEVKKHMPRGNRDLPATVRAPKNTSRFTPTAPSFVQEGAVAAPRDATQHSFGPTAVSPNRPKAPAKKIPHGDLKKALVKAPRAILARQVPAAKVAPEQRSQLRRRASRPGR